MMKSEDEEEEEGASSSGRPFTAIPKDDPLHTISSCFLRPNPVQYGCLFNTILHDHHLPRTRGSRMALLITIRTNNSRTRGKILAGLTLQGTGRRNITADLSRWHYRSDCPELKNQNHENGGTGARGVVHALGGGETNQDHNDMEEDINA
ncbi:hypothetical protein Tco_0647567 [Tanacetum coccineum]